jgi:hypothetical protein
VALTLLYARRAYGPNPRRCAHNEGTAKQCKHAPSAAKNGYCDSHTCTVARCTNFKRLGAVKCTVCTAWGSANASENDHNENYTGFVGSGGEEENAPLPVFEDADDAYEKPDPTAATKEASVAVGDEYYEMVTTVPAANVSTQLSAGGSSGDATMYGPVERPHHTYGEFC